ncbi:hypothetical protein GCM10027605_58120 [Micromonospora zhanjiangensis]
MVPGVPRRGQSEIAQLERSRLHPGAVAESLREWRLFVHASRQQRAEMRGCGQLSCCLDPLDHRRVLELAICAMTPTTAKALRKHVEELDALADWDELLNP